MAQSPEAERLEDFAAVKDLPTPSLEALLRTGDGPERVWAAWSLGLRKGASALPSLVAAVDEAPDPGVRASVVVILAGHLRIQELAPGPPGARWGLRTPR